MTVLSGLETLVASGFSTRMWTLRAMLQGHDLPVGYDPGAPLEQLHELVKQMRACRCGVVFFGLGLTRPPVGHANVEALLRLVTDLNAITRFHAKRMRIYGDVAGDIVWKPAGASPIRQGWQGLLPVPGDGRFEWQGLADPDDGPVEVNPPRGFIATANAMNLPPGWQGPVPGHEWLDPSRHDFLNAALAGLATANQRTAPIPPILPQMPLRRSAMVCSPDFSASLANFCRKDRISYQ